MGSGFARRKKMFQAQQSMQVMQKQLQDLVMNPEGAFQKMAAPLLQELETRKQSERRLSALACALLQAQGGNVVVNRGTIEQFQGKQIYILTDTPADDDGVNPDCPITFSYTAEPLKAQSQPAPTAEPLTIQ